MASTSPEVLKAIPAWQGGQGGQGCWWYSQEAEVDSRRWGINSRDGMGRKSDKCQGQGRAGQIYTDAQLEQVENCLSLIRLEVLCADSLLLDCPDANFYVISTGGIGEGTRSLVSLALGPLSTLQEKPPLLPPWSIQLPGRREFHLIWPQLVHLICILCVSLSLSMFLSMSGLSASRSQKEAGQKEGTKQNSLCGKSDPEKNLPLPILPSERIL